MGSHKKHKEKGRRKKKIRSRSRSKSRDDLERDYRAKSRSPAKRRLKHEEDSGASDYGTTTKKRNERHSYSEFDEKNNLHFNARHEKSEVKSRKEMELPLNRPAEVKGNTEGYDEEHSSLSIEETNKLRARLGLNPLKRDESKTESGEMTYEDRADVHAPAINMLNMKQSDALKDKLETMKEKRRIEKKLQKKRTLDADDNDTIVEGAAAWVEKIRNKEHDKQLALKRAKLLEEMDGEFGVTDFINEEIRDIHEVPMRNNAKKQQKYGSGDLAGLKIEHSGKDFQTGSSVVLTLKDQEILSGREDILENINMIDDKMTTRNVENRKKTTDYRPFEEIDEDTGMVRPKVLLEKYNEEIEGHQESYIMIDSTGKADIEDEKELDRIRSTLKAHQITLEMPAPKLAKDYWSQDDMVRFKKPAKKKRKIRKREIIKADDLIPLAGERINNGSRTKLEGFSKNSSTNSEYFGKVRPLEKRESKTRLMDFTSGVEPNQKIKQEKYVSELEEEREFLQRMKEVENAAMEDDEAELELQIALERSRKAKIKRSIETEPSGPLQIARQLAGYADNNTKKREKKISKGTIVMDSTSEFCRTLGEVTNIGMTQEINSTENEEGKSMETTGGWEQVVETEKKEKKETQKYEAVLEEEPDLKVGIAAALKVASIKGFVEMEKKKVTVFPALSLPQAKAVIDEEKMRDEERERYHRGHERERYDPYAFKEKESYKPEIKLEYVDEHGRPLNEKEAFRFLSHKFHGKGSGKMKTEKRAKKLVEEMKLRKMSATDTPLNTAQMMAERQHLSQTPYVVLSGGGKNLLTTNIISKK